MNSTDTSATIVSPSQRPRRWFFLLAAIITLVVLFYAIENWRGQRAWESYKRELLAQGEKLDWDDYALPSVPADEDFLKVPLMDSWFNRATKNPDGAKRLIRAPHWVTYLPPKLADLRNWDAFRVLNPRAEKSIAPQAGASSAAPDPNLDDQPPTPGTRADTPAAELVRWFKRFDTEFKELHQACQRPHARLDGGFAEPFSANIPHFINLRTLAQALSTRAKSNLVLGHPDEALGDLAVIRRLMDVLHSSQYTLVASMIRVALAGLYLEVVAEGLEENLWQEPQWKAIQEQLQSLRLLADVVESIRGGERAAVIRIFEQNPRQRLAEIFGSNSSRKSPVWLTGKGLFIYLAPRGWFYQNLLFGARLKQRGLEASDLKQDRIDPSVFPKITLELAQTFAHWSPYHWLSRDFLPNFTRALQTTARNQTRVNEAILACALERCRKAERQYPEKLETLAPRFVEKVPRDLINGQPLKYQRSSDGRFLLYSVGWNEKDDGGSGGAGFDAEDWVWP